MGLGHMFKVGLTADDLRKIANTLETVATAGIDITEFKIGDVTVRIHRHDDQRDGTTYRVVGIVWGTGSVCRRSVFDAPQEEATT